MKRELSKQKPEGAINPKKGKPPIESRFDAVDRTRFSPRWKPETFYLVTGLIELGFYLQSFFKKKSINMVEVGTHGGESALIFDTLPFVKNLSCVDIWKWDINYEACASRLRLSIAAGKVKLFKMSSDDAVGDENFKEVCHFGNPDFVYLDADHSYLATINALEVWHARLAEGGIIGGHDYSNAWPEVVAAVDEFADFADLEIVRFNDASFILIPKK